MRFIPLQVDNRQRFSVLAMQEFLVFVIALIAFHVSEYSFAAWFHPNAVSRKCATPPPLSHTSKPGTSDILRDFCACTPILFGVMATESYTTSVHVQHG